VTKVQYSRVGQGEPLVLLHGLGSAREAWDPIVPALAERFDVIAVDLPGFGASQPLAHGVEPNPAALARAVADLLDALSVELPHLVGNSLGGWVAVKMAKASPTRSLTLLSPAGLWPGDTPLYCRASLRLSRGLARHAWPVLSSLVTTRLGRVLVLGQMHAHPTRQSTEQARAAIRAMGRCPGFDATLDATTHRHLHGAQHLTVPVTVAFGSRHVVLLKHQSRRLTELPRGTRSQSLPGCGHVPMNDDPSHVVDLILAATSRETNDGTPPRELLKPPITGAPAAINKPPPDGVPDRRPPS
jgi:pimeloyl-ACP methyl ester carboxylesterase